MILLAGVLASSPAFAQSCAEVGQNYIMYTYKDGARAAVQVLGEKQRAYMLTLGCKYDYKAGVSGLDLGFGKVCAGREVQAGGKPCKVEKVEAIKQVKPDDDGVGVRRRAPAKK
jgi:hypothetical protein